MEKDSGNQKNNDSEIRGLKPDFDGQHLFDKLGIDRLPSSMCSVFAASAILIVPMILILLRRYPTKNNLVGAVIIMSGIFLILVCGFQMSPVGNPLFLILSIGGILGLIFAIF